MAVKTATKPPAAAPAPAEDEIDDIAEAPEIAPDGEEIPRDPADVQEEDDELDPLAPIPWFALFAPEDVATGDGRRFASGSLTWRDLPQPLQYQPMSAEGHGSSAVVGRTDGIEKDEQGRVWGWGVFLPQLPYAGEALDMVITGASRGVSVDVDSIAAEMASEDDVIATLKGEAEMVFSKARISGLTMVSIPAFAEAFIALGTEDDMRQAMLGTPSDEEDIPTIAASAVFPACDCESGMTVITDEPFTYTRADYTDAQWAAATVGWSIEQEPIWPILTPSGELSREAVHRWSDRFEELSDGLVDSMVEFARAALDAALVDLGDIEGDVFAISEAAWDGSASRFDDQQWQRSCVLDKGEQAGTAKQRYALPIREPNGDLSRAGVHAAAARLDQVDAPEAAKASARSALAAAYKQLGEDAPEGITAAASDSAPGRLKDGSAPKCKYGPEQATKYVLHSEGMAFIPTCDEHLDQAKADAEKSTPDGKPDPSNIVRVGSYAITASAGEFAPGTHDGPGWITHPRDTERLRNYWVRGKGAAKIRWGTPGDFNRCRKHLGKYVEPRFLAGTCANLHKEAIKVWPGEERPGRRGNRGHHAAESLVAGAMFNFVSPKGSLPPAEFFQNPQLEGITQMVVEDNGHVYGHLAEWGTCHIGIPGTCVTPPRSYSDYAYYHTGEIETDAGPVSVGHLTMGIGHASLDPEVTAAMATAHYDRDDAVIADVVMGEDEFGIWFSGMIRPGTDVERVAQFKANGSLSGDWRYVHGALELIGAVAVNTPGFPIPRTQIAASAGIQTALVAAGMVRSPEEVPPRREMSADEIAAISRAAVAEFIAEQRNGARVAALRARNAQFRAQRISALRARRTREEA